MSKTSRQKSNGACTLREAAEEVGVSPERIRDWLESETDKTRPTTRKGRRPARLSGADVRRLVRRRLFEDIRSIFAEPDVWLDTPNHLIASDTPREAIQEGEEQRVINLIEAIKHGMVS
jgi:hypothetical protein